jgi:hypothetical protein
MSKFIMCFFTTFWINLYKFIVVKMGNPLINMDQLLQTNEFTNS